MSEPGHENGGMTPGVTAGVTVRRARRDDVGTIVRMLADDVIGATREVVADPVPATYLAAFDAIEANPNALLLVAEAGGTVVATCQVVFLPGLSRQGAWRAQLEAVRVSSACRGQGVGGVLVGWVVAEARRRGCRLVQLASDRSRRDAHRFYERLGFVASHRGMKLPLDPPA